MSDLSATSRSLLEELLKDPEALASGILIVRTNALNEVGVTTNLAPRDALYALSDAQIKILDNSEVYPDDDTPDVPHRTAH